MFTQPMLELYYPLSIVPKPSLSVLGGVTTARSIFDTEWSCSFELATFNADTNPPQ